jgi:uncharacterized protein with PQ loop repeat
MINKRNFFTIKDNYGVMMETVDIVGITASFISVIYTGLGMPVQIYKNFKVKSTKGLSLSMMILMFSTLTSWVIYGILKIDWYIVIPNFIGMITVSIIFVQFWIYRKSSKAAI